MNFIFPYFGNNHPNFLIFFRGGWNHQPIAFEDVSRSMTAQSSKGSRCTEKSKDRHRQIIFPRPDGRTDGSIRHHFLRFLSHPPHSTHHRTSYDPFNTMKSHAIPWKINISNERTNPLNNMSNPIKISCKSHPSPVAHVPEARLMALCCPWWSGPKSLLGWARFKKVGWSNWVHIEKLGENPTG